VLQSPVVDKTGLAGQYDIELSWRLPGAVASSDDDPLGKPTLFLALEEQLALKLERGDEDVEFLAIDDVQPPLDN
jgi:uncharacterized protein (TIGR03435 family)